MPAIAYPFVVWVSALFVVCTPFINMALIWLGWQAGVGCLAWSTARFYSNNCAAPGVHGFISSLFTMGSPICVGAWFSHAAFAIAYITSFVAAILIVTLWLWNRIAQDSNIKKLQQDLTLLRASKPTSKPTTATNIDPPRTEIRGGRY